MQQWKTGLPEGRQKCIEHLSQSEPGWAGLIVGFYSDA